MRTTRETRTPKSGSFTAPPTGAVFEPLTLLPSQAQSRGSITRTGEMRLLWAVFTDGVEAYTRELSLGRHDSELCQEAESWIRGESDHDFTSFENLCALFALEAETLRARLLGLARLEAGQVCRVLARRAA